MPEDTNEPLILQENSPAYEGSSAGDIDLSLLKESLQKTPWERMQANDDGMNFAASLRAAMLKRNAKLK